MSNHGISSSESDIVALLRLGKNKTGTQSRLQGIERRHSLLFFPWR
jgi:hypothetical protein